MGSRCWDCGTKMGRCYEHGSSDCDCIGCGCEAPLSVVHLCPVDESEDVDW